MRKAALIAALAAGLAAAAPVSAHNAGHIVLAEGTCVNVGSDKNAPYVPDANPNQNTSNEPGRLDLEPGPGDQFGARFAADRGSTPILPKWCEEVGLTPGR